MFRLLMQRNSKPVQSGSNTRFGGSGNMPAFQKKILFYLNIVQPLRLSCKVTSDIYILDVLQVWGIVKETQKMDGS